MSERHMVRSAAEVRADHAHRYRWARRMIAERFGLGARVNDLACGCGYGAELLDGLRVYGGDISPEGVAHAQRHFSRPGATFEVVDLEAPPVLPAAEAVVSFETIEHLNAPAAALQAFAAAAPVLFGSVPNEWAIPFNPRIFPYHARHYTQDQIAAALEAAGYTRLQWFGQQGKTSPVGPYRADSRTIVFIAERESP